MKQAPGCSWTRLVALLGSTVGCGGGGQGTDPDLVFETETSEALDDGAVDDTGGPVETSQCLPEPRAGRFGYKYQCAGSIIIDFLVEGNFAQSPVSDSLVLEFGAGVEGDSYDEPLVMACCPEYDPEVPSCAQGHEQACMTDLVEQGCKSMEPNLRDLASDEFGGSGVNDAIARAAIGKIADHVRDHQQDCVNAFFYSTGISSTPPSCGEEGDVDYDAMLETGVWSFDPAGVVTNVEVSVGVATLAGLFPLEGTPEQCDSADENDHVVFIDVDPDPGSMVVTLMAGGAELHGPAWSGSLVGGIGVLGSTATGCEPGDCSTMALLVDAPAGLATLERLELRSAGPTEVGDPDAAMTVEDFRVRLWDRTRAVLDGTGNVLTVPPGTAWFAVSAKAEGAMGVVAATNETALILTRENGAWSASGLTLAYQDGLGDHWALVVTPTRWQ